MVFLLIRTLPFILPIIYFLSLKFLFFFSGSWYLFLILILVSDFIFFFLLNKKFNDRRVFIVFIHSVILVISGFAYTLLLDNQLIINFFIIFWSLIYLIYLESVFHFFYQTIRVILIDFANIVAYVNLATFFFALSVLINFNIFLNLTWWWVILIVFVLSFILIFNRFLVLDINGKRRAFYSLIIAGILAELLWALLLLPASFFVLSLTLTLAYYLLSSLAVLKLQEKLSHLTVWKYLAFVLVILVLVVSTAGWI